MKVYPVIDIKGGKCVRTRQGMYYDTDVYSHHPAKVAKSLQEQGATYLQVIDVDGAMFGHSINEEYIAEIIQSVTIPVQVGGGIRTIKDIDQKLSYGAARVVIGTKAAQNPAFVKEAVNIFGPERLVVSIDIKNNAVMMDAWEKASTYSAHELTKMMKDAGIKTIIYTDVEREGMIQGVNIDYAKQLLQSTDLDVIISGGVSSLKDLELLYEAGASGVLLGKLLYENHLDLDVIVKHFSRMNRETAV
ncbi:MAG: 1-(5-phosphoribosyl)-5-[(5-phosphoribosylamino)methylideneamino]imidazole-4-carboxamide isomerase [bacterium]|nr:1-(5-phosphoribosyl)-5-[(5-phosphoribosylamino)methylideneamino]imidazole-4-carboxamide isomerase [bacterium]